MINEQAACEIKRLKEENSNLFKDFENTLDRLQAENESLRADKVSLETDIAFRNGIITELMNELEFWSESEGFSEKKGLIQRAREAVNV